MNSFYKITSDTVENSVNYKVMVISPSDLEYSLIDGNISYIGKVADDVWHVDCLNNYGVSIYGKDSIFGIFSDRVMPNVPIYFLTEEFDNVIFLNLGDNNHGDRALVYLPTDISFKQMKSTNLLLNSLKGFKIKVISRMFFDDGIVDDGPSIYIKSDGKVDLFDGKLLSKIRK